MEGDGGKKGVRRPMNAFLIFCKRHRSKVREKNPEMDNRSITRVLGDLWAKLGGEEKATFTNLAKQYKDAFMKANPDYKWHASDKVHGGATSKLGATKPLNTASSSKNMQEIPVNTEVTLGKLADPGQMGGLNLLLRAGKETNLTQQKMKPSSPSSSLFSTSFASTSSSSLFSSTPVSIPAKLYPFKTSFLSSVSSPSLPFCSDAVTPSRSTPQTGPIVSDVADQETNSANSALLQLAEMCTTELYSSSSTSKKAISSTKAAVAPPKKRAKHWSNQLPSTQPLQDENGQRPSFVSLAEQEKGPVVKEKEQECHNVPLDLSQSQQPKKMGRSKKSTEVGKRPEQRKRKLSSSATDSVSSQSPSPVNSGDVFSDSEPSVKMSSFNPGQSNLNGENLFDSELLKPLSTFKHNVAEVNAIDSTTTPHEQSIPRKDNGIGSSVNIPHDSGKFASLLKASPPVPDNVSSSGKSPASDCDNKQASDLFTFTVAQPFTQGKLKKKWTQRMLVEAKQEELFLERKAKELKSQTDIDGKHEPLNQIKCESFVPNQVTSYTPVTKVKTEPDIICSSLDGVGCHGDEGLALPQTYGSKEFGHGWGVTNFRNPLPPPPPIVTSFPTGKHQGNTLYKALTSEISPPRQCGPRMPSLAQEQKIFKPIAACGKKIVDHIVEKLIRTDFSKDKKETQSLSLFSPSFGVKSEPMEGKPVDCAKEERRSLWSTAQLQPMVGDFKAVQIKDEPNELHGSFPAISLVEKMARQVCDPQALKAGIYGDIPTPDSKDFSRFLLTSNHPMECDGGRKVEKMEGYTTISKPTNDVMVEPCDNNTSDVADDQNSAPVRKSRRANRGQKYQALIKEGIIQPSKERLAARNCAKVVRSFSAREDCDHLEAGRPTMEKESTRSGITREMSEPARKVAAGEFDLEKEIASLPVCSLAQMDKKRPKGRCESDATRTLLELKEEASDMRTKVTKREGEITVPNDIQKSATFHLSASESGCRTVHIPLPKDELSAGGLTGSRKRKARKHFITRISVVASNDQIKDMSTSNGGVTHLPPAVKDLINTNKKRLNLSSASTASKKPYSTPLQDLNAKSNVKQAKSSLPVEPRGLPVSRPDEQMLESAHVVNGGHSQGSTALNILTSAAIESERAAFPSWPRFSDMNNSSVTSHGERPEPQQQPVAKCSPLTAVSVTKHLSSESIRDSTTVIKSGPASVPMEEAHVSNIRSEASSMPQFSFNQPLAPSSTPLITSTAYSSQLLQSISSTFLSPGQNQTTTPLLQAMTSMAPATLTSLSNAQTNPRLDTTKPQPSPFVVSTLPTSGFQQNLSRSDPKLFLNNNQNALAMRHKSVPLKVPIITSGDVSHLKKDVSHHMADQDRGVMKTDKETLFQHSKKLVKLLLNTDTPNPLPPHVASDASVTHRVGSSKQAEMMPTIHYVGEPPVLPIRKKPGVKRERKKQLSNARQSNLIPSQAMKGYPPSFGKLFSAQQTGSLGDSAIAKKHKPTIWDHLSSQCPVPLKSVKAPPPAFHKDQIVSDRLPSKPVNPLVSSATALSRSRTVQNISKADIGSDTDSANEGNGHRSGSSDTDSADESETNVSNSVSCYSHHPSAPITSSLLSNALQPKTVAVLDAGSSRLPSQLSHHSLQPMETPGSPPQLSRHSLPLATPSSRESIPTTLSSCDKSNSNVLPPDPLPPSFVAISSITLPSDIPESDLLASIKSSSNPPPQSPQFIVKTIPPTSSFPCPHVTDLSSTPAATAKVTPASCILLSTLQSSLPVSPQLSSHSLTPAVTSSFPPSTPASNDGNHQNYNYNNVIGPTTVLVDTESSHPCNSPRLPGSPSLAIVQS